MSPVALDLCTKYRHQHRGGGGQGCVGSLTLLGKAEPTPARCSQFLWCAPCTPYSLPHTLQNPALLLELYEAAGQQGKAADFHFQTALDLMAGGQGLGVGRVC